MQFKSSEDYLVRYLDRFFKASPTVIEKRMVPIVAEQSKISLRFIENFVTKYCHEKPVFIKSGKYYINVYDDYQSQLDSYDKKKFDPFKRKHSKRPARKRTTRRMSTADIVDEEPENTEEEPANSHLLFYPFSDNRFILTSIGQLNFFRWLIETKILDYIEKNYETLKKEMSNMDFSKKKLVAKQKIRDPPRKDFSVRTNIPPPTPKPTLESFQKNITSGILQKI